MVSRSTLVVQGRLANRGARLGAARDGRHGVQIMSFEQAAARLAGGFVRPIDDESLREAIQAVLPVTAMGELESIKLLPGMVGAAADTLHKAWRAGIELGARAAEHPRLDAIARLEAAVLAALPQGMMRPADIVAAATARVAHASAVLGPVEINGLTELSPCWRPLLALLARHVPVRWLAGPRSVPDWIDGAVSVSSAPAASPTTSVVSAATVYHEAVEAMRWARSLLASGIPPADIAIATTSPAGYDDHFMTLRGDANIDLHFVHGVRTVNTRDGQAAAAIADILVRGISQTRIRRLASLCGGSAPLAPLPERWLGVLPTEAPLSTIGAWNRLLARLSASDWPDGVDHTQELRAVVTLLAQGTAGAAEVGAAFLTGRALSIWRKALLAGPATSIDITLEALKQDDGLEACVSVAWMPASALAASPRPHVRLIGLNSSRWPRSIAEDRLIPDHVIPTTEFDPLPVTVTDRRDFATILATTTGQVVLSHARRDSDGRLLGRSPLLAGYGDETYLRRNAVPAHAFSETDRLMARPADFAAEDQAAGAGACWRNWRIEAVTPHDGLVRPDHPVVLEALGRLQSASSLKALLRSPINFVWKYALGWKAPQSSAEPLMLDSLQNGNLIHAVLDRALRGLEPSGGLAEADGPAIEAAVAAAAAEVAAEWESERPVPPHVIWGRTLFEARALSVRALSYAHNLLPGGRSYSEVPFGGSERKSNAELPWDPEARVTIPGTGFSISGYIDRLDVSADGTRALVRDYKTGKAPREAIRLNKGSELQRCLYAFAVRELLGEHVDIVASLLYPREPLDLRLDDPGGVLDEVTGYLAVARASLTSGAALPGPDTGGAYDDLAFALPANAGATYCRRKSPAVAERLGEATLVWEAE
jgi:RecB family exonuclease